MFLYILTLRRRKILAEDFTRNFKKFQKYCQIRKRSITRSVKDPYPKQSAESDLDPNPDP